MEMSVAVHRLTLAVRTSLLRHPDIHIVSDGKDVGKAQDFVKRVEHSVTGIRPDKAVKKAVERLMGIVAIGLNVQLIHGRDIAQFDSVIEKYSVLAKTVPVSGLTERDYEFFSAYAQLFDGDYFIAGMTSTYKNYDWAYYNPALIVPRVEAIIKATDLSPKSRVLDFGCAVGFYVQSLLEKGFEAKGMDISKYAIEHARPDIKAHLILLNQSSLSQVQPQTLDLVLAKDVLEHIPELILPRLWAILAGLGKVLVITVPIANSRGEYVNPEDEHDLTHVVRKNADWWLKLLGHNARRADGLCRQLKGRKAQGTLCAIVKKGEC